MLKWSLPIVVVVGFFGVQAATAGAPPAGQTESTAFSAMMKKAQAGQNQNNGTDQQDNGNAAAAAAYQAALEKANPTNKGGCDPGTVVQYRTVSADHPYVELHYLAGGRVQPYGCVPDPKKNDAPNCSPMLSSTDLSFKVSDLESATKAAAGDDGSFLQRLKKIGKVVVNVGSLITKYGAGIAVNIPVGPDQLSLFLSDMNDKINDASNDKQKVKDAANALHGIFNDLLTGCSGNTHANFANGTGLVSELDQLFQNMSTDQKVDMGDDHTAIMKAAALGEKQADFINLINNHAPVEVTPSAPLTDLIPTVAEEQFKPIVVSIPSGGENAAGTTSTSATH